VDNIVEEIKALIEKYGIKGIAFSDELVVISRDSVLELCDKIGMCKKCTRLYKNSAFYWWVA